LSLRRCAVLLLLLHGASAVAAPPADAGQEPVATAADTALYRQGQADGMQLAQAIYCELPQDEIVRVVQALQGAARDRARAAGVAFDPAQHEAAMQTGFGDFMQLMATLDAGADTQDPARRQAHHLEQCAEVRTEVDTLLGSRPREKAQP